MLALLIKFMRSKSLFLITLAAIIFLLTGCGGPVINTNSANSTNVSAANTNSTAPNSNEPLATTKKPEAETTNNAPTLKPVVDAYYDAITKKDDAAIRKVLAAQFQKTLEAYMKDEKKTNLVAYIAETDRVPDGGMQVRNEKITGDAGIAELKGGTYPNWTPFGFVKENGTWKFSGKNPDMQTVDQSKGK